MIKVGSKIEFKSGMKYEVIKTFPDGKVDLKALVPQFEWMPDFYPTYYSIDLEEYKILNDCDVPQENSP